METKDQHGRFKDAEWFGEDKELFIGGTGGTGSWLAVLLARMGNHTIHVYDHDVYEAHNMAGQFVNSNQIGKSKVEALAENLKNFSIFESIYTYQDKYTSDSPACPIMFSCFDNMKARRDMFTNWRNASAEDLENLKEYLFVDLRLLAESATIFFVQADKIDQIVKYEAEYLPDDSQVPDADCTLKQTSHAAALIASLTVGFFTNWLANRKEGFNYRKVPFKSDYMIALNMFENEYV